MRIKLAKPEVIQAGLTEEENPLIEKFIIFLRESKTAPKREGAVGGRDGNDGFAGCAVAP